MTAGIVLLMLLSWPPLELASVGTERVHIDALAHRLACESEVVLPDGSRVDLLTDEHAIEVEWAPNWAQAIGQATLYSIWTDRPPAVYLLVRDPPADRRYVLRAALVCQRLKIQLRTVRVRDSR